MNKETRQCQNCKQEFTVEPEDFLFYEKMKVPSPTFCPECRLVRRLAFRNERSLYHQKCALCKKEIISVFSPKTNLTVYCSPCWWSDKWDATAQGVDYDFSKSFFAQLQELLYKVPVMNRYGIHTAIVNSDYVNMATHIKDCYLCTYIDYSESCLYSSFVLRSRDSVDCLMLQESELCYQCVNCHKCFRAFWSLDCENCHDIWYSRNCIGCSNCFGCVNLVNKNYYIFNKPYTKEEYELKIRKTKAEDPRKLWDFFPQKYMHGRHNVNVSGEYIYNSKNIHNSYLISRAEDCRFCSFADSLKDSYDFTNYGDQSELLYETLQCGDRCSRIRFSWLVVADSQDIDHSIFIIGSRNIFGCVGIKKKQYCILNKQYSKMEFESLQAKIIQRMKEDGEYGQFFPISISPFGYNETTAQEYFPLTKEEVERQGLGWKEEEMRDYKITKTAQDLPDHIKDVDDSILQDTIQCAHLTTSHVVRCNEQCTTAFRIIPQELEFYRKMNLPLPRLCPNCRHYQRLKQRNPLKLWKRNCQCSGTKSDPSTGSGYIYPNQATHFHNQEHCPNEFETSYAPNRPEIVYCESCYNSEII